MPIVPQYMNPPAQQGIMQSQHYHQSLQAMEYLGEPQQPLVQQPVIMQSQQMVNAPVPIPTQYAQLYSTPDPNLPPGYQHLVPVPRPPAPSSKMKPKGTKLEVQHDRWYNMNEIVVENIMQTHL